MAIRIKIKDLRAINKADISLDGITVLSGINGSGKSTVSRFTYEFLSAALNYNDLVDRESNLKYMDIGRTLFSASMNLSGIAPNAAIQKMNNVLVKFVMGPATTSLFNDLRRGLDFMMDAITKIPKELNKKQEDQLNAFYSTLSTIAGKKEANDPLDRLKVADNIESLMRSVEEESVKTKSSRAIGTFQNFWKSMFVNALNPERFNVEESGVPMLDTERGIISLPNSIGNVFYVDSPMALGEIRSYRRYWKNLNRAIQNEAKLPDGFGYDSDEDLGLLGGSFEWKKEKTEEGLFYTRPDGISFNLLDCATGLKSFSIIQMLFRDGLIDGKTLMILDEPESHLHPQWIIEYARLIVRMHKEIGVRFLIASHNPDMVNAIKSISEKELGDTFNSHLNFYIAEEDQGKPYSYSYRSLGTDIAPIFKSFNIALDRIDKYAE